MSEPVFDVVTDDDLPLTVLRERDAREREARERQARERGPTLAMPARDRVGFYSLGPVPQAAGGPASMLDASFVQLAAFFFRAALAALPAAVLVIGALWLAGHTFAVLFPGLLKLKVLLYVAQ
jgi:hypothetical protein